MKNLRPFFFLLFLTIGFNTYSQQDELSTPELYFGAVIVSDLDTAIVWYQDILGFKLVEKTENEERGFKQANLANGRSRLELIESSTSISKKELHTQFGAKARYDGLFKLGFRVKDFNSWLSRLRELKVTFSGDVVSDPQTDKKMVILLDPDGNRVQMFEQ